MMGLLLCLAVADLQTLLTVSYYYINTQYNFSINIWKGTKHRKIGFTKFFSLKLKTLTVKNYLAVIILNSFYDILAKNVVWDF